MKTVLLSGLLVTALGSLAAFWYKVAWPILKRLIVTQVDFTNDDPSYQWVLAWLNNQPYLHTARHVRVISREQIEGQKAGPIFIPPSGLHWLFYRGRLLWIWQTKERIFGAKTPSFAEELSIFSLFGSSDFMRRIVYEAKDIFDKKNLDTITAYIPSIWEDKWAPLAQKPAKQLSSLVFDDNVDEKVLEDLKSFSSDRDWYTQMGIPWRRGYLLYGKPGTGKTALIGALAGELGRDLYVLNLSTPDWNDDAVLKFINKVPTGAFLILEEIDCIFKSREDEGSGTDTPKSGVTLAGLLTALDGLASGEGRVLFMTTNHVERLDPALIRPGRVDLQIEMREASRQRVALMAARVYPDRTVEEISLDISQYVKDYELTMAEAQEMLITNRDSYGSFIKALAQRN